MIPHVAGCSITACHREVLALGLCRYHYDRQRDHGDPLAPPVPRGPKPNPHVVAMTAAGVTEQQRSSWALAGLLGVRPDRENPRNWEWTAEAAQRAVLIRAMINAGITLSAAGELLGEGIELRPGVRLRVTWDTP